MNTIKKSLSVFVTAIAILALYAVLFFIPTKVDEIVATIALIIVATVKQHVENQSNSEV